MRKIAALAVASAAAVVPFLVAPAANATTTPAAATPLAHPIGTSAVYWAASEPFTSYDDNTFELDNGAAKAVFAGTYLTVSYNGTTLYQGGPGNWLELSQDGDMDLLSASGYTFWDNGVHSNFPYYGLNLQANGDLVEWGSQSTDFNQGTALWATNTFGS